MAFQLHLQFLAEKEGNSQASLLSSALEEATSEYLQHNKSPSRQVGELDTRVLTIIWPFIGPRPWPREKLKRPLPSLEQLQEEEKKIIGDFTSIQGPKVDIEGYYAPSWEKMQALMRPSKAFNAIIDSFFTQ